jgi:hypothetical protein
MDEEHREEDEEGQPQETEDPDAELETAWERSKLGIRANPKRFIRGLVYSEEDKIENRGKQPPPAKRTARLRRMPDRDEST